jgi:hypothetical protein
LDDIPGSEKDVIEHRLRQFSRRCVLLAGMVRAENRGLERMQDVVTELKIGHPFDAGPKFHNSQPGIESQLTQRDDDAQIGKGIQFPFQIPAAIQQFFR